MNNTETLFHLPTRPLPPKNIPRNHAPSPHLTKEESFDGAVGVENVLSAGKSSSFKNSSFLGASTSDGSSSDVVPIPEEIETLYDWARKGYSVKWMYNDASTAFLNRYTLSNRYNFQRRRRLLSPWRRLVLLCVCISFTSLYRFKQSLVSIVGDVFKLGGETSRLGFRESVKSSRIGAACQTKLNALAKQDPFGVRRSRPMYVDNVMTEIEHQDIKKPIYVLWWDDPGVIDGAAPAPTEGPSHVVITDPSKMKEL